MKTDIKIRDAAIRVLAKKPTASLDDIASNADVTRMTLLRYFKSRENLILEASNFAILMFGNVISDALSQKISNIDRIKYIIEGFIPLYEQCIFLTRFINWTGESREYLKLQNQYAQISKIIEAAQADGDIRKDFVGEWGVLIITYISAAIGDINQMGAIAKRDSSKIAIETFMNGFNAKK